MESPIKENPKMFTVQFEPETKSKVQTLWMFKDGTVVVKMHDGNTLTLDRKTWTTWVRVLVLSAL